VNPERWRQIEELYHSALKLDRGQRAAFLRARCGGDEALLLTVESLLDEPGSTACSRLLPSTLLPDSSGANRRRAGRWTILSSA
jgi:hypothetical protein